MESIINLPILIGVLHNLLLESEDRLRSLCGLDSFHNLEVGDLDFVVEIGLSELAIELGLLDHFVLEVPVIRQFETGLLAFLDALEVGGDGIVEETHSVIHERICVGTDDGFVLEPVADGKEVLIVQVRNKIVPRVE
jgi:hypothetical protein